MERVGRDHICWVCWNLVPILVDVFAALASAARICFKQNNCKQKNNKEKREETNMKVDTLPDCKPHRHTTASINPEQSKKLERWEGGEGDVNQKKKICPKIEEFFFSVCDWPLPWLKWQIPHSLTESKSTVKETSQWGDRAMRVTEEETTTFHHWPKLSTCAPAAGLLVTPTSAQFSSVQMRNEPGRGPLLPFYVHSPPAEIDQHSHFLAIDSKSTANNRQQINQKK